MNKYEYYQTILNIYTIDTVFRMKVQTNIENNYCKGIPLERTYVLYL